MQTQQTISFVPLFFERVWGGRHLELLFSKPLPSGVPVGESWEIVDRADAQSVVAQGPLAGRPLHSLWKESRADIFGNRHAGHRADRFPLLCKWLDARDRLSVQVHPPASVAPALGGEPKTEMWHVAHAEPDADLFAGLKAGVTREAFGRALEAGTVESLIHRIPTREGATIFIPSGRIHAIGAGNVITEIQQNSDTTYRVFDWNRLGLDGKPRAMHVDKSMQCIDFSDFEPSLQEPDGDVLVSDPLFRVSHWDLDAPRPAAGPGDFAIFTVLKGRVRCGVREFGAGDFFLVPACMSSATVAPVDGTASVLQTILPG